MTRNSSESLATSTTFLLYELGVATGTIAFLAPYALYKMIRTPSFRAGIGERLSLGIPTKPLPPAPIWIQAVSLGEVRSVTPLVRRINQAGERPIFVTSTTETGRQMAEELLGDDNAIGYFPLDFTPIMRRMLRLVHPRLIVLFETELWPNLIRAAALQRIPVAIVNGRISEKSFRYYRMLSGVFRSVLSGVKSAGMQSNRDAQRIMALGASPEAVEICGNIKFDAAPHVPSPDSVRDLRNELMIGSDDFLIVAGSTHDGEEAAVLEMYRKLVTKHDNVRLLIAPRHPERFDSVEALIRDAGMRPYRRSRPASADGRPVILLDTIGELARVYALASVAFVGGSLAKIGGHNIIEPAAMGKPVIFGPFMHHFEDVKEAFLAEHAALCVNDARELYQTVESLSENPQRASTLGDAAKRVVEANRGATERYFRLLEKYFATVA